MKNYKVEFRGKTFTRQTARVYTHVIIVEGVDGGLGALAWVGRPDLLPAAIKNAGRYNSYAPDKIHAVELAQP